MTFSERAVEAATPESIATEIVSQLSFPTNRMVNGRLIGEQHFAYEAIVAAIKADRSRNVPAGHVVVPIKPTSKIIKAYIGADRRRKRYAATAKRDWSAMLTAASDGEVRRSPSSGSEG